MKLNQQSNLNYSDRLCAGSASCLATVDENISHTWHLSKHVRQTTESLPVQFHFVGHEGAFQEEVVPHALRHGRWDENTQILQETKRTQ